ncbi:MAG: flagellar FlbD family protein [Spirochaetales bacterium]|nr:flagellar FlbD family protein [Spirochaetales bacterium]
MVKVTMMGKMNKELYLNPHQIEYIEAEANTTIVMLSGKRLVIQEDYDTVFRRIVDYRRLIGGFKNEE